MKNGTIKKDDAIRAVIKRLIEEVLHFPNVNDIIEHVKIQFDYYDVSDELLSDSEFIEMISRKSEFPL